jgi:hypothetical protein
MNNPFRQQRHDDEANRRREPGAEQRETYASQYEEGRSWRDDNRFERPQAEYRGDQQRNAQDYGYGRAQAPQSSSYASATDWNTRSSQMDQRYYGGYDAGLQQPRQFSQSSYGPAADYHGDYRQPPQAQNQYAQAPYGGGYSTHSGMGRGGSWDQGMSRGDYGAAGQSYGQQGVRAADEATRHAYAPGSQIWEGGQTDMGRGQYGRQASHEFEPDYLHWREQQLSSFDNDYRSWRDERRQKFSSDFDTWRTNRPKSEARPQNEAANPTVGDVSDGGVGHDDKKKN